MTELNKIFKHLSRDVFVYCLTGFLVIINLMYIDYHFKDAFIFKYVINMQYWAIAILILSFAFGHIIFALMYVFFECSGIEGKLKLCFFKSSNDTLKPFYVDYVKEISIFKKDYPLHEQFIERHNQLYLMRWNFSGGLIFSGLFNLILEGFYYCSGKFTLYSIGLILIGFLVYILSLRTEKDCSDRVIEIDKLINKE